MKQIISQVRRCVQDYAMIAPHDRIAVGVSGGKDSLALLLALHRLSGFYPIPFTVEGVAVDMGTPGMDFGPVARWCAGLGIPFHRVETQIYAVIFQHRQEKNPCSLCAKMRKGAIHGALRDLGITKVALGHHYDDAVETFFLSLFYEGRISCFQPVTYLDRTGVTQVRPLLYCTEEKVAAAAARNGLPVVKNRCPADGYTRRQEVKELVAGLTERYPDLKERVFGAMRRLPLPEWGVAGPDAPSRP